MMHTINNNDLHPQKVLVCGGAGYIGSHMARMLTEHGHQVTVLDNLSTGRREALNWGNFFEADIRDKNALRELFKTESFDLVFHFSALIAVGESVREPLKYYDNNVAGTLCLLQAMLEAGIKKFVFSSTAAVYGNPVSDLIDENHPLAPLNPYGHSKLMVERILADLAGPFGLRSVSFRYFNAAGAHPDGDLGEAHGEETHLIPNIIRGVIDQSFKLKVFGKTYPTRDGTCVRDYIHVNDLCRAHLAAIPFLESHDGAQSFNLGNGKGFTVLEVIEAVKKAAGKDVEYETAPPREGDSAILVADGGKARRDLGWAPEFTDIDQIIKTAWTWHSGGGFAKNRI